MISHKSSCFCVKEWCKVLATLPSLSFLLMGWMLEEINSFAAFNTCPFVCLSLCLSLLCLLHPVSIFFTNVGLSCLFYQTTATPCLFICNSVSLYDVLKNTTEKVFCVLSSKLISIIQFG